MLLHCLPDLECQCQMIQRILKITIYLESERLLSCSGKCKWKLSKAMRTDVVLALARNRLNGKTTIHLIYLDYGRRNDVYKSFFLMNQWYPNTTFFYGFVKFCCFQKSYPDENEADWGLLGIKRAGYLKQCFCRSSKEPWKKGSVVICGNLKKC